LPKPVLDNDETILIKHLTNSDSNPNPAVNPIPKPIPNCGNLSERQIFGMAG